ncbi:uncharacterized protein Dwil_GK20050 [Drosophila willistoni]|uniref:Uncharacterized protein n=1 Tax=Drosophila willistoni TaxID=7260 RepID=B4MSX0_DROWI|nr:uncharacterized protein LOC6641262 [Drosophila willistoni]EDW75209.1 uncharacterized protein Dwil_GK20050 [Drosophila willistoni]
MLHQAKFNTLGRVLRLTLRSLPKGSECVQSCAGSRSFGDVAKKPLKMPQTMVMAMPMSMPQSSSLANTLPMTSSLVVKCKHSISMLPDYTNQQKQKQKPFAIHGRNNGVNQQHFHQNHNQPDNRAGMSTKADQLEEKSQQPEVSQPVPNRGPIPRPMHNPLSRRHTVDRARLQYINDMFKELANEVETRKPRTKKFVSRQSLHSGRIDKID